MVDRLIQQAVLQILQPAIDPTFSVVDVDLEKYFDRVQHDVLMGRLAKRINDEEVLRLCAW